MTRAEYIEFMRGAFPNENSVGFVLALQQMKSMTLEAPPQGSGSSELDYNVNYSTSK